MDAHEFGAATLLVVVIAVTLIVAMVASIARSC